MSEHLLLELLPGSAGDDGNLHDAEKSIEELCHLRIDGGFAFGQGAVQVEDDELFHALKKFPGAKSPTT